MSSHDHASHAGHSHAGHSHAGHSHAPANYNRAFAVGLVLNVGFVIAEFGGGFFAHSVALMADAGHNLSDVLGLLLAWGATIAAKRRPSRRKTYGWRKSSVLAAFLNAMFLMLVTGGIVLESLQRLAHPDVVQAPLLIGIAAIGIVINGATALMFLPDRQSDINIRAAFSHMLADALVSLGVVVAGIGILFTGWYWLDPVLSLVISGLIIWGTWSLLQESFHLVIDGVPPHVDERAVQVYLADRPAVVAVHDLHIWSISTTEVALTAHLVMSAGHPGDDFLAMTIGELAQDFGIHHATLQLELGDPAHPCRLASDDCV
jgi:cobalt-zinc-cadmium efflux system protein